MALKPTMRLYVMAGNYEQARKFAWSRRIHYTHLIYVHNTKQLKGIRGVTIYAHETAVNHPNFNDLVKEAKVCGDTIKFQGKP